MTVDQVKGLEFQAVIVFSGRMTENEKYLSFTRALDELIIYDREFGVIEERVKEVNQDSGPDVGIRQKDEMHVSNNDIKKKDPLPRPNSRKNGTKAGTVEATHRKSELVQFFEGKGLEVIDRRQSSGLLWIIGSREQLMPIIREASRKFRISGQFGKDRDTGGRQGWYTKSKL